MRHFIANAFSNKIVLLCTCKIYCLRIDEKYLNSIQRPRYASVIVSDKTAVGVSMLRCSEDKNAFFSIDKLNAKYKNPKLCDITILRITIYSSNNKYITVY